MCIKEAYYQITPKKIIGGGGEYSKRNQENSKKKDYQVSKNKK